MKAEMIRETIEKSNPRSAWDRGVKLYALDLLEDLEELDTTSRATIDAALLNGADSWQQYSDGGCALIYDGDVAERLCTPSELKRCKGGERRPNAGETWLDVQRRALWQAATLVWRTARDLERGVQA